MLAFQPDQTPVSAQARPSSHLPASTQAKQGRTPARTSINETPPQVPSSQRPFTSSSNLQPSTPVPSDPQNAWQAFCTPAWSLSNISRNPSYDTSNIGGFGSTSNQTAGGKQTSTAPFGSSANGQSSSAFGSGGFKFDGGGSGFGSGSNQTVAGKQTGLFGSSTNGQSSSGFGTPTNQFGKFSDPRQYTPTAGTGNWTFVPYSELGDYYYSLTIHPLFQGSSFEVRPALGSLSMRLAEGLR